MQGNPWTAGFPVYSLGADEARTKEGAIRATVGRLIEAGQVGAKDLDSIVSAILKREFLGSTGIGRGLAMPHTSHAGVDRLVGAVAKLFSGVDFDSLDGKLVYVLCLFICPFDRPGDYLHALEAVSRSLRDFFA